MNTKSFVLVLFILLTLGVTSSEQKSSSSSSSVVEQASKLLLSDASKTNQTLTEAYTLAKEAEHYLKSYLKDLYNNVSAVYEEEFKDSSSFYERLSSVITPKLKDLIYSQKNAKAKSQEAAEKIDKLFDSITEDIRSVYPTATKLNRPADMNVSLDIKTGYKTFSKYAEDFADKVVKLLDEVKKNKDKSIETTKKLVSNFLAAEKQNIFSETHLSNGIKGTAKTVKESVSETLNELLNKYLIKIIESNQGTSSSSSSSATSSSTKVPNPNKVKKDEIEPQLNGSNAEEDSSETVDSIPSKSSSSKQDNSGTKIADDDDSNQEDFEELLESDLKKVDTVIDKAYATAKEGETLIKSYIKELYNTLSSLYSQSYNSASDLYEKCNSKYTELLKQLIYKQKAAKEKIQDASSQIDKLVDDILSDLEKTFPKVSNLERTPTASSYADLQAGYKTLSATAADFADKIVKLLEQIKSMKSGSVASAKSVIKNFIDNSKDTVENATSMEDGIKGVAKSVTEKTRSTLKSLIEKYQRKFTETNNPAPASSSSTSSQKSESSNTSVKKVLEDSASKTKAQISEAYSIAKEGEHFLKSYIKELYNNISSVYGGNYNTATEFYNKLKEVMVPGLKQLIYSQKSAKAKIQEASQKVDSIFDSVIADLKPYFPKVEKLERSSDASSFDDFYVGYKTFSETAATFADKVVKMMDEAKTKKKGSLNEIKAVVNKFLASEKQNVLKITHLSDGIKGTAKELTQKVNTTLQNLITKYQNKLDGYPTSSSSTTTNNSSSLSNSSKDTIKKVLSDDSSKTKKAVKEAYTVAKEGENLIKSYINTLFSTLSTLVNKSYSSASELYSSFNNTSTELLKQLIYKQKAAKEKVSEASSMIDTLFDSIIADLKQYFPEVAKLERSSDSSSFEDLQVGYKTFSATAADFADKVVKLLEQLKSAKTGSVDSAKKIVNDFIKQNQDVVENATHLDDGIKGTAKTLTANVERTLENLIEKYSKQLGVSSSSSDTSSNINISPSTSSSSNTIDAPDDIEPQTATDDQIKDLNDNELEGQTAEEQQKPIRASRKRFFTEFF